MGASQITFNREQLTVAQARAVAYLKWMNEAVDPDGDDELSTQGRGAVIEGLMSGTVGDFVAFAEVLAALGIGALRSECETHDVPVSEKLDELAKVHMIVDVKRD